jgi:hypothetical protein
MTKMLVSGVVLAGTAGIISGLAIAAECNKKKVNDTQGNCQQSSGSCFSGMNSCLQGQIIDCNDEFTEYSGATTWAVQGGTTHRTTGQMVSVNCYRTRECVSTQVPQVECDAQFLTYHCTKEDPFHICYTCDVKPEGDWTPQFLIQVADCSGASP